MKNAMVKILQGSVQLYKPC